MARGNEGFFLPKGGGLFYFQKGDIGAFKARMVKREVFFYLMFEENHNQWMHLVK